MLKLKVFNREGKESESLELPDEVFGGSVNTAVLHQAVVKYQASLRQGNASTKERSDISGGGKKPFRQKGTGRARAGSTRSPLWKKGGVIFGPHPRDFGFSIPKSIKRVALRESLKAKVADEHLVCIQDVKDPIQKTKEFAAILKALKLRGKILAILDGFDQKVTPRSTRNLPLFNLMRSEDINAYDVLRNKTLLVSKTAIHKLIDRIKGENSEKTE